MWEPVENTKRLSSPPPRFSSALTFANRKPYTSVRGRFCWRFDDPCNISSGGISRISLLIIPPFLPLSGSVGRPASPSQCHRIHYTSLYCYIDPSRTSNLYPFPCSHWGCVNLSAAAILTHKQQHRSSVDSGVFKRTPLHSSVDCDTVVSFRMTDIRTRVASPRCVVGGTHLMARRHSHAYHTPLYDRRRASLTSIPSLYSHRALSVGG